MTVMTAGPPASAPEALAMLTAGMSYLAAADPASLTTAEQAECLAGLERAGAIATAARTGLLGAFTAARGHAEDADYSPRSWLIHKTRITKGAATGHTAWTRRARAHPRILAALATGDLTESYARTLCTWTSKLPGGLTVTPPTRSWSRPRSRGWTCGTWPCSPPRSPPAPAPRTRIPDTSFDDRAVRLDTTFQGAGLLSGDLTPECAALVETVLAALSAPRGAEDGRSHAQRYHDGLAEAMHRLVSAGLLPERAGQPARVWAHISLADLMVLDAKSALQDQWAARVRARWAGHRAAASVAGGDGAAWLDGDAAEGFACDASLTPVVYGEVSYPVLDDLVRLCLQLARHRTPDPGPGPADPGPA